MRRVLVSQTALKVLDEMPAKERRRLVAALGELADDPFRPRPRADVKALEGTQPPKWRLRVGDWRVVYVVDANEVRVIEVFRRGRGYRVE